MTAEIAIMNKQAIALASDSAVTMMQETGQKIFKSANKLFALSKYHPIGIMVYGNADFMSVPWETIIKIYRSKLSKKKFDTVKEYADDFMAFLDNGNPLFPDNVQKQYLVFAIFGYFYLIKEDIKKEVKSVISENFDINHDKVKQITSSIIEEHYNNWKNLDTIPSIPETFIKDTVDKYDEEINKEIHEVFENLPISKHSLNQIKEIAASLFSKFHDDIRPNDISGVVIAGYGEKDAFPSLKQFDIEGIVNNKLKYKEMYSFDINYVANASITTFAQGEMVKRFMEGVDPSYMENEEKYLYDIFNIYEDVIIENLIKYDTVEKKKLKKKLQEISKEILEKHRDKLKNFTKEEFVEPITSVVSMLPKDELAIMAETLVNLTLFKRKVTMRESETVGGPIDVAVISKGDGFIWIKRKHYFKPELNPNFFTNYYKEETEDEKA